MTRNSKLIAAILAVPLLIAFLALSGENPTWFPRHLNYEFYVAKAMIGMVATVLIIVHMSIVWTSIETFDRQMRYLCLLYFVALVTASSLEQISDHVDVNWRNLGGMFGVLLATFAAVLSLRNDRRSV